MTTHQNNDNNNNTADNQDPITPNELKELKRVFNQLCYFAEKAEALKRLKEIRKTLAFYPNPSKLQDKELLYLPHRRQSVIEEMEEYERVSLELGGEKAELEKVLRKIEKRPVQHIRLEDTTSALKSLGMKPSKKEVLNMMWEVDENLDGVIDWEEFCTNFERNIQDRSGLEPANFYHLVQFMIYDKDNNGMVSIDETMYLLYARLGRDGMESTISKLFGGEDGAPVKEVGNQGGEVDFQRYWEVLSKEQLRRFHESDLGKIVAGKKGMKSK